MSCIHFHSIFISMLKYCENTEHETLNSSTWLNMSQGANYSAAAGEVGNFTECYFMHTCQQYRQNGHLESRVYFLSLKKVTSYLVYNRVPFMEDGITPRGLSLSWYYYVWVRATTRLKRKDYVCVCLVNAPSNLSRDRCIFQADYCALVNVFSVFHLQF